MNVPSKPEGNWCWRFRPEMLRPDLAEKLVALANERDGSDNISVQLIRVRDVERMGMYRGRPYKLY